MNCFLVSDLHGKVDRYKSLFNQIKIEEPEVVLLGGDLLPGFSTIFGDFVNEFLIPEFSNLKQKMQSQYPQIYVILGNDDPRSEEQKFIDAEEHGLWTYLNEKTTDYNGWNFFGYSYIPPSPFQLKDWEKFDVSRYVDIGCISPLEGMRTVKVDPVNIEYYTIAKDLDRLLSGDLSKTICLFHAPPYNTFLDRAALDGKKIDHVQIDVHVGSIAIKNFIESKKPAFTLHGHIHESTQITGSWKQKIGSTLACSSAWEGSELALIKFDPEKPDDIQRVLI